MSEKGTILSIHKFALHDGPGIRTAVFLKGCPLQCQWCHNPESISKEPEIAYYKEKCTNCGACADACTNHAHTMIDGRHHFNRTACTCNKDCVKACAYEALVLTGEQKTTDEIIAEVLKDKAYYEESNGGMTISGGEPLYQADFTLELLKKAKKENIHTCLDTCGLVSENLYQKTLPLVDLYLFDYKATNTNAHKKLTGANNEIILSNLDFLYQNGAKIELRCPLIPSVNDSEEHLLAIANMEKKYPNLTQISIMPFHNIARGKYEQYGYTNPLPGVENTSDETKEKWKAFFEDRGCEKVLVQ